MKNIKTSTVIFSITFLGCASAPEVRINSSSPARIEVDGEVICESTPCVISANFIEDDYGFCRNSKQQLIEAYPLEKKGQYVQKKIFSGDCGKKSKVYFDMDLVPASEVNVNIKK